MKSLGFELSYFHPSVYRHNQRDMLVLAHVDDFMCLGRNADLRWMFNALKSEYSLKMELMSFESGDSHFVKFLNRTITMGEYGITIEGDSKHTNILIEEWGMREANGVDTPLTTDLAQLNNNRPLMSASEAKHYRRAVARVNFMAQDRCDLSSAVKVLSQSMANPREGDEGMIKRVIRYLRMYPI